MGLTGLLDPQLLLPAVVLLVVFLVLTATFAAFSMVGFTPIEVVILLFLAPFVAWVNVPVWSLPGLIVGVNAAGLVIPAGLSVRFLIQDRLPAFRALLGVAAVTVVAFQVATVQPETGVLVPALPVILAAAVAGLLLAGRKARRVGPLTYTSGSVGTLVGADLLHLNELTDPGRSEPVFAVIGGAGTLDAIYLVSLWAVAATMLALAVAWLLGGGR